MRPFTPPASPPANPPPPNNRAPIIKLAKFKLAGHDSRSGYYVTSEVQLKICDDQPGRLLLDVRESKGSGSYLQYQRRTKTLSLQTACGLYAMRWRLANKFFGVGDYKVSVRARDSAGLWSNEKSHHDVTTD
jgi:hypothetical protein